MRTIEEINKKVNELHSAVHSNKLDVSKAIIYTDALCWVLGDDYLNEYNIDFKALYETKCDEVDTLYRIIFQIYKELSLLKLKDCPEEEFKNIALEICYWIEQLMRLKEETGVDKNGIYK